MGFCPNCALVFPAAVERCPLDGSALSSRTDPFEGVVLAGKYRLVERIGMGGMGYVYRGRHVHMERDVAVKILPVEATSSVDVTELKTRFVREARAADLVRHENIVEIYEIGESRRNISFMVMELLSGRTLEEAIAADSISVDLVVSVMRQVCSVLGPTHAMGIIHRDLKPENVFLIERDGRDDFVKILDFGVAHLVSEPGLTVAGQVLGTPEYMSPEQARGERPGPQSDLYALGCIAYDMIAGHPPFNQGNMMEIMRQQIVSPPPPLREELPHVPAELESIVMKLLSKDPQARYMDGFAVMRDLDALAGHGGAPAPRDSRLSFGKGGPLEAQGEAARPPAVLDAWRGFIDDRLGSAEGGSRRVLYEMEELVGQLESLVSMMERICTIMEVSLKERRQEGRTIRYAIAKFAESGSLKRAALREGRERYERLKGQVSELDTRLAVALVELKTSSGTVNVGAPLGDDVVQACAELGRLAAERQQRAAELRSVREGAQQLMGQIRDTERQIATMRQRLEAVIGASARCGADQQTRIESLEQQRAQVEARLCGLVAELG